MRNVLDEIGLNRDQLREAIQDEYKEVANHPDKGFHFHTGRKLAQILGYQDSWLEGVPEATLDSFAGTGNPFSMGELQPGERIVDIACGAGVDSFIAAKMVGPTGYVVGVDMTKQMIAKARRSLQESGVQNLEFCHGFAEDLPVTDGWADVVISNGSFELMPDKAAVLVEINRILKPGGRVQFGDILVDRPLNCDTPAAPTGPTVEVDLST